MIGLLIGILALLIIIFIIGITYVLRIKTLEHKAWSLERDMYYYADRVKRQIELFEKDINSRDMHDSITRHSVYSYILSDVEEELKRILLFISDEDSDPETKEKYKKLIPKLKDFRKILEQLEV